MNGTLSADSVKPMIAKSRELKPASGTVRVLRSADRWLLLRVQTAKTLRICDCTEDMTHKGLWVVLSKPEGDQAGSVESYLVDLQDESCDCVDGHRRQRFYPTGHELRPCKHQRAIRAVLTRRADL